MVSGTVADLSTQARKADGAIEFRMAGGDCGMGETGSVLGIWGVMMMQGRS
jgi:hypothetical protein